MEQRADSKRGERDAKETLAAAQNGDDGVEKADGVESGGYAKPEETGFGH
jgi:hypothetical protein